MVKKNIYKITKKKKKKKKNDESSIQNESNEEEYPLEFIFKVKKLGKKGYSHKFKILRKTKYNNFI